MNGSKKADSVEQVVAQWRAERPDLNPWPSAVAARILRLATHLRRQGERSLESLGLSWESFEMLAALLRSGPPYALNPTTLYRSMLLTSGAMTNRLDKAEEAGLVRRASDPTDRRATLVQLTPVGRVIANEAIELYFRDIGAALGALSAKDRGQLAALLSSALLGMENSARARESNVPLPARRSPRRPATSRT